MRYRGRIAAPAARFASARFEMYPKARLDALTDGVFAVAMTLLVLDIRLPEDFHPHDQREFILGILRLWPKFLPYVISFSVLSFRWLASIHVTTISDMVSSSYARWWLLYLFFITCVPFTSFVIGRYPHVPPAIWLYAGNAALIAAVSARMLALLPDIEWGKHVEVRRQSLGILFLSAVVAIGISFIYPRLAMLAMALNLLTPLQLHWHRRRAQRRQATP